MAALMVCLVLQGHSNTVGDIELQPQVGLWAACSSAGLHICMCRGTVSPRTLCICAARALSVLPCSCLLPVQGHSNTVEDVVFQPGSAAELASVADDSALLLWDTRSGTAPVLRVADAHGTGEGGPLDLHVVDWNPLRPELLATGGSHMMLGLYCRTASSCRI